MFPPPAIAGILTLVLGFIEVDTDSLAPPELGSWGIPTIFWDQPA
jgi:hypothetical protein